MDSDTDSGEKHDAKPDDVDEFVFRQNEGNCKIDTVDRLRALIKGTAGKRLTYKMLVHGI